MEEERALKSWKISVNDHYLCLDFFASNMLGRTRSKLGLAIGSRGEKHPESLILNKRELFKSFSKKGEVNPIICALVILTD
jgi:hypothetical protein